MTPVWPAGIRGTLTFRIYHDEGRHRRNTTRDRHRWIMEIRFKGHLVWHCAFQTQAEAQEMVFAERKRLS